jgi:hypothetical protein
MQNAIKLENIGNLITPLNVIHWKPKIFNTSFYDTLLVPNEPDSLGHHDKTTFCGVFY